MVVCTFFRQGRCHKGQTCRFEHPATSAQKLPSDVTLNATARPFNPKNNGSAATPTASPCIFFLQGTCRSGVFCRFSHEQLAPPTACNTRLPSVCKFFLRNTCAKGSSCPYSHASGPTNDEALSVLTMTTSECTSTPTPNVRNSVKESAHSNHSSNSTRSIGGADVRFDAGAAVTSLSLPSDFSIVSMTNIPGHKTVEDIIGVMATYGFPDISPASVTLHTKSPTSPQSAQVKVNNPTFAKEFLQATGPTFAIDQSKIFVSIIQLGGESAAGSNRLHLTGVTCTWYQPSRIAYLRYDTNGEANSLVKQMKKRVVQLHGRQLTFARQDSPGSVTVSNLTAETRHNEVNRILPKNLLPLKITMGPSSHCSSAEEIERQVKKKLEGCGTVLEFTAIPQGDGSKMKATAKFVDIEAARKAVNELNDDRTDPLSKDKLRLQHLVSIKLSVSLRVLQAIRPQLEMLTAEVRETSFVNIKVYDNPTKLYTQIRVSGQNKDSVAQAKTSIEKFLAGKVFTIATTRVCRQFFFNDDSKPLLDNLMRDHNVYVVQDRRKMALRLYGDPDNIKKAQEILTAKVEALNARSKIIVLDSDALSIAIRGGFGHLVQLFGKDCVKMDITSTPKCIVVTGSERLAVEVEEKLLTYIPTDPGVNMSALSLENRKDDELCPVCWTPPEDPFTTECGHIYCGDCLSSQCSSTGDFPIICLGASANCNHPLSLKELERVLTSNDYEALLQRSFTNYIRSHPNNFQYCSTPDCDHCYRPSAKGSDPHIFTCDGCLTSICTGCNQVPHDGLSCAASKAAVDGTSEFARYRQENDVRDCPSCRVPIEKSFGCNHMECMACKIHICWFCMETFKTSAVTYEHMGKAHGEIGL
ncbi:hypothetical protein CC80DRAFT_592201 [Byssothecium circinans]|uniref:RING-type E3 ubiquitin transferase n=1 Tax=Byssothecium circinans TaxID=147558 RepID=A0A6A5U1G8_9PLEO|nr:hypothetical protein CC80DRAFT_592201 [Byssothecium circinans]